MSAGVRELAQQNIIYVYNKTYSLTVDAGGVVVVVVVAQDFKLKMFLGFV